MVKSKKKNVYFSEKKNSFTIKVNFSNKPDTLTIGISDCPSIVYSLQVFGFYNTACNKGLKRIFISVVEIISMVRIWRWKTEEKS